MHGRLAGAADPGFGKGSVTPRVEDRRTRGPGGSGSPVPVLPTETLGIFSMLLNFNTCSGNSLSRSAVCYYVRFRPTPGVVFTFDVSSGASETIV